MRQQTFHIFFMTKIQKLFFAGFLLIFFLGHEARAEAYFAAETISPILIDPPFSSNSLERKNEIQQIVKLQKNVSLKVLDAAFAEYHFAPEMLAQVDPALTREKNPQVFQLLERVSGTAKDVNRSVKNYWNVPRPYIASKSVKILVEGSGSPAYPSGHTCSSYVTAHILSLLFPQKRREFFARAEEISQHRVLVGMHYPQDLEAGKQLALLVVGGLMQNTEFQKDFEKAQKEIKKNN